MVLILNLTSTACRNQVWYFQVQQDSGRGQTALDLWGKRMRSYPNCPTPHHALGIARPMRGGA